MQQKIEVLKGKAWEFSDNFILKDESLIERLTDRVLPCISKLDLIRDEADKEHSIRVETDNCSESAKMVLIGTHFI